MRNKKEENKYIYIYIWLAGVPNQTGLGFHVSWLGFGLGSNCFGLGLGGLARFALALVWFGLAIERAFV